MRFLQIGMFVSSVLVVGIVAVLLSSSDGMSQELPTTKAERVGMSSERLNRISELSKAYVASGQIPGLITMVARDGKIVHFEANGQRGIDDLRPLKKDDLFRLFSMTKPVTAVAIMQLYEQGKFQLRDPVSKFVPELKNLKVMKDGELVPVAREMTMHNLLTHTAGLSYGFDPNDPVDRAYVDAKLWEAKDLDEFAARLGKLPLKFEPGTQWHYSVAVDLTGVVIERLGDQPLNTYLKEQLFRPLDMRDTSFVVPDEKLERFLPNHFVDPKDGELKVVDGQLGSAGIPSDIPGNCFAMCDYQNVTLFAAGGGLVSTARDYMRFAEMLRNGGTLNGIRILSPKTIGYMTSNHLPAVLWKKGDDGQSRPTGLPAFLGFGLGVGVITDPVSAGIVGSKGEYFWNGASGAAFWIDPVEDIVVIGLMQRMGEWPIYQPDLKTTTYQAITESKE